MAQVMEVSGEARVELERIPATVRDLKQLVDPRIVAPGHCTGWRAAASLTNAFSPGRCAPSVVGTRYTLRAQETQRYTEGRRVRAAGWLLPGIALAVAAGVHADGALLTSAYRTQTTVSDDRFSYPWIGATAVTTSLVWGVAQVLILVGLVGFSRSGAAPGRTGRSGTRAAVAGAALYVAAHAVSIVARDAVLDDPIAIVAISLFAVGTVLTAVGLLMAGASTLRSRTWSGWRRRSPTALGAWMVVMVPLQFTPALPVAVGVLAAATIALGVALAVEIAPGRSRPHVGARP